MAAVYPTSIKNFTTKEDKIDVVDDDHMNDVQNEINAIETELGLIPAGSFTNLVDRLALLQDTDGSLAKGTSFPTSPIDGQGFYRTDLDTYSIYDGSSWQSLGQSLSNQIFSWSGVDGDVSSTNSGYGTTLGTSTEVYYFSSFTSPLDVITFRYTHIAGIGAVNLHAKLKTSNGSFAAFAQATINGTSIAVQTTSTSYAWLASTGTLDVSGCDVGTTYNGTIALYNPQSSQFSRMTGVAIISV